jgi:hypothetical protein
MKQLTFLFTILLLAMGAFSQDTAFKEMTGKYKFPPGSVIDEAIVTYDNGTLMMNSSQGASALEKIKGDTFNVVSFKGIAIFKRDETQKIAGVHVDASGYVLDGTKEPAAFNDYSIIAAESLIKMKEFIRESIQYNHGLHRPFIVCIYN